MHVPPSLAPLTMTPEHRARGRATVGFLIPENYKHEVIGHAKSALDKRYVQEIPLADTYPAMRGCNYSGLVLPTAP